MLATDEEITAYLRENNVAQPDIDRYLIEIAEDPSKRPSIEEPRAENPRKTARNPRNTEKTEPVERGSAPVAVSPADVRKARNLLTRIGQDFAENRQKSKSKAFETYQRDLAMNQGSLVMGGAVTLKEITVLLMDLEGFMKSTVKEGETAATRLQKFLSGELEDEE